MKPEQAEWVRANVWTQGMRNQFLTSPGYYTTCACLSGMSSWCRTGKHERCHRASPLASWEGLICDRSGKYPVEFREEFRHPSQTSATGPSRERLAMVWLADRVCRWVCPCECGHPTHAELVTTAKPAPLPEPSRPVAYELVTLPGLELAGVGA